MLGEKYLDCPLLLLIPASIKIATTEIPPIHRNWLLVLKPQKNRQQTPFVLQTALPPYNTG